jgi:hypothetical protein
LLRELDPCDPLPCDPLPCVPDPPDCAASPTDSAAARHVLHTNDLFIVCLQTPLSQSVGESGCKRISHPAQRLIREKWRDPAPCDPARVQPPYDDRLISRAFLSRLDGVTPARPPRVRSFIEDVGRDLRHGWRVLQRARGFTLTAVLMLAVCIGANSAMAQFRDG